MITDQGVATGVGQIDTAALTSNGDSIVLTYTNGADCQYNGVWMKFRSVITFTCDPGGPDGQPVYERFDYFTCVYYFKWSSGKACPVPLDTFCTGYVSGQYYDLSALTGDYAATDGAHVISIGVCHTPPRSKCADGVAGCLMYPEWGINLDLGQLHTAAMLPQRVGTAVVLTYQSGASCGNGGNYSMTISFQCNPDGPDGQPTLVSFDAATCVYHFAWSSGQACPKTPPGKALNSTL